MAADSLAAIDTWREPDRLLERIRWVVGPRPGSAAPDRAALEARFGRAAERIELLEGPALDLSSTEIRARVAAGRPIRYLVPRGVEELIAERGPLPPMTNEEPNLTDQPERVEIPDDAAALAHRIVEIASDKKGNDIVMLRTAELTSMADFFVICSGRSRPAGPGAGRRHRRRAPQGGHPAARHRGPPVRRAGCSSTSRRSSSTSSPPRSASSTASNACGPRPRRSSASSESASVGRYCAGPGGMAHRSH